MPLSEKKIKKICLLAIFFSLNSQAMFVGRDGNTYEDPNSNSGNQDQSQTNNNSQEQNFYQQAQVQCAQEMLQQTKVNANSSQQACSQAQVSSECAQVSTSQCLEEKNEPCLTKNDACLDAKAPSCAQETSQCSSKFAPQQENCVVEVHVDVLDDSSSYTSDEDSSSSEIQGNSNRQTAGRLARGAGVKTVHGVGHLVETAGGAAHIIRENKQVKKLSHKKQHVLGPWSKRSDLVGMEFSAQMLTKEHGHTIRFRHSHLSDCYFHNCDLRDVHFSRANITFDTRFKGPFGKHTFRHAIYINENQETLLISRHQARKIYRFYKGRFPHTTSMQQIMQEVQGQQ